MAVAWTLGPFVGGPLLARLKLSVTRTLGMVVIVHSIVAVGYLIAMLFGCPAAEWAGTMTQQGLIATL